jgi:subtilisin family serine protease
MTRRLSLVVLAVSIVLAPLFGNSGSGARAAEPATEPDASLYEPADGSQSLGYIPGSILARQGKPLNVLIEMTAPPLAEVFAQEKEKGAVTVDVNLQHNHVDFLKQAQAQVMAEAQKYGKIEAQLTRLVDGVAVSGVAPSALSALARLPGVKAVHPMGVFKYELGISVPFIGGQQVLEQSGLTGRGTTIAVLDTGLDYTHRDFGGPGTVEAYNFAKADPTRLPGDFNGVTLFPTEKVIGGWDFVGPTWTGPNPPAPIPQDLALTPSPNPIDFAGHGSHTAGIAAGFGVPNSSEAGSIPDSFVKPSDSYKIFHGVAPASKIIAYKVCSNLVNSCDGLAMIAAFDRAAAPGIDDGDMNGHVDSINMSIGSEFGADVPNVDAANRAVRAGIAVAISAGNSSDVPFITGAPSVADKVLGVASSTAAKPLYGLKITAPPDLTSSQFPFIWQPWSGSLTPPTSGSLKPTVSRASNVGCTPFPAGFFSGKIAVINRGACAVSDKGFNAQQAGAKAAIIVSQATNPPSPLALGDHQPTIPVIMIANANGAKLYLKLDANIPVSVEIAPNQIATLADVLSGFTSRGPSRFGNLKPDITAPGGDIVSARAGAGDQGVSLSGTSMAAPHIAGSLALMKQAHPDWKPQELEAVLVNTAKPDVFTAKFIDTTFDRAAISRGGAGRVDLVAAAKADTVVLGDSLANVSIGFQAITGTQTITKPITIVNKGESDKTYDLASAFDQSTSVPPGVTVSLSPSTVTVAGGKSRQVNVAITLNGPALRPWGLKNPFGPSGLNSSEVAGLIWVTDRDSGQKYHLPFYALPRGASAVSLSGGSDESGDDSASKSLTLTNSSAMSGKAELFDLLVANHVSPVTAPAGLDIRQVGARVMGTKVEFAINTKRARGISLEAEFDILIDLKGTGVPDFIVFNTDVGGGNDAVYVYNVATNKFKFQRFTDTVVWSSNLIESVNAADIGLSPLKKFNFWVEAWWNFYTYKTLVEEYAGAPLVDRAPDTGSVAFNAATPRYTPSAYTVDVVQGTPKTVTVSTASVEDDEVGILVYYRNNVPPGRDADIVKLR